MVVPENEDRGETSQLDDVMYIDNWLEQITSQVLFCQFNYLMDIFF